MKIYLAGSWELKPMLQRIGAILTKDFKHEITSTWLYCEDHELWKTGTAGGSADRDIHDIMQANLVIFDLSKPSTTGGYHFEQGFCYGYRKAWWIVGSPLDNSFQVYAQKQCMTWFDVIAELRKIWWEEKTNEIGVFNDDA